MRSERNSYVLRISVFFLSCVLEEEARTEKGGRSLSRINVVEKCEAPQGVFFLVACKYIRKDCIGVLVCPGPGEGDFAFNSSYFLNSHVNNVGTC